MLGVEDRIPADIGTIRGLAKKRDTVSLFWKDASNDGKGVKTNMAAMIVRIGAGIKKGHSVPFLEKG